MHTMLAPSHTTTTPCSCWGQEAYLHGGHCCFGPRTGETGDQWRARMTQEDDQAVPACHFTVWPSDDLVASLVP